jgi:two-component system sensor histidine kinase KdpD
VAPLAVTLVLIPWRSSVGIAGALFAALLGVVAVAAIGGIGPAAVAIVVGFLTADFFFTVPYDSLRVDHVIDVIALISFAIIGGVVGVLVDVLSRQGVEAAGSRTEAEGLARLAAESLSATPDSIAQVADSLRDAFDLGSVSVLQRVADGWSPEFVVGDPAPHRPEETPFTAELSDGRVLTVATRAGTDRDPQLLRAFIAALRHRREQDQLARLVTATPDSGPTESGRVSHD